MADLAQKLGLNPGSSVCMLGAPAEAAQAIRAAALSGVKFFESLGEERFDLILFWPRVLEGLVERFASLQYHIRPDGAIWAVIPKKAYARRRGVDFTWEQLQAAGLQTDLVDNKTATVTEEDYGTRFVIRKEYRAKYG